MLGSHRVFATIPATDLKRARRWYEQKLGLKPAKETAAGLMYQLGSGTGFLLYPSEFAGKAPNTLLGFESANVEKDVAALRKKGVTFEEYNMPGLKTVNGIAMLGTMKGAWFKDSEGNILSIGDQPA